MSALSRLPSIQQVWINLPVYTFGSRLAAQGCRRTSSVNRIAQSSNHLTVTSHRCIHVVNSDSPTTDVDLASIKPLSSADLHHAFQRVSDKLQPQSQHTNNANNKRPSLSKRIFVDRIRLSVSGGKGGHGCASFLRTKDGIGGPDGANGGAGGNVTLKTTKRLQTYNLQSFHIKGSNGQRGSSTDRVGANGKDTIIEIPAGTVVHKIVGRDSETGKLELEQLIDLHSENMTYTIVRGGRGGQGNRSFRNSNYRKNSRISTDGEEGEQMDVILELKSLADVGLVGFPNAGKSSLLGCLSRAKPTVASYPFTTLQPYVGVVECNDPQMNVFTVADLPGLIDGAHINRGLGHEFLRHIERTSVLLFVLDIAGTEGRDPCQDYLALRKELQLYQPELLHRPAVIYANKMDRKVKTSQQNLERLAAATHYSLPIISGSCLKPDGNQLQQLIDAVYDALQTAKRQATTQQQANDTVTMPTSKQSTDSTTNDDFNPLLLDLPPLSELQRSSNNRQPIRVSPQMRNRQYKSMRARAFSTACGCGSTTHHHHHHNNLSQAEIDQLAAKGVYHVPANDTNTVDSLPLTDAEKQQLEGEVKELQQTINIQYNAGEYEAALQNANQYLQHVHRLYGTSHPAYASALVNQALLVKQLGNLSRATQIYKQALIVYGDTVGRQSGSYATCLHNLAVLKVTQNDLQEAELLFKESLHIRQLLAQSTDQPTQQLRTNDANLASSVSNLATIYTRQSKYDEAIQLQRTAVEMMKKRYGSESTATATAMSNLAYSLKCASKYDEALKYCTDALGIRTRNLPPAHTDTIVSLNNLAELHTAMKNEEQADKVRQYILQVIDQQQQQSQTEK